MRVAGIIAECNPLHEGHTYLLEEARSRTGADYVVVAMSGDYVQRGAPSVLSRESRAKSLLLSGADLVVELPLYVSCAGADYFARGGVALIESLGVVTDLVFGSESGDLSALQSAADKLAAEDETYKDSLREGLRSGLSFPQARAAAYKTSLQNDTLDECYCTQGKAALYKAPLQNDARDDRSSPQAEFNAKDITVPETPNDLLGMEYLKALRMSGSSIRPHAVPRISCRSASEIRAQMLKGRCDTDPFLCRDDFSDLLLHALLDDSGLGIIDSAGELSRYLDVSPDMARRILHEIPSFTTYSAFCDAVKTRNYTYTRISRALLHILLGMSSQAMEHFDNSYGLCGWIRPIGFKKSAAPLIRAITSECCVPFLDKLAAADKALSDDLYAILLEEIRAEFLYDLMAARRTGQITAGVPTSFRKPLIIL